MFDENAYNIYITVLHRLMQRRQPALIPGHRVGTVFNEEPYEVQSIPRRFIQWFRIVYVTMSQRLMQRCHPLLIPGCCIGAMLDEKPREVHKTILRRLMQWC